MPERFRYYCELSPGVAIVWRDESDASSASSASQSASKSGRGTRRSSQSKMSKCKRSVAERRDQSKDTAPR
jgi:hypothetical protein